MPHHAPVLKDRLFNWDDMCYNAFVIMTVFLAGSMGSTLSSQKVFSSVASLIELTAAIPDVATVLFTICGNTEGVVFMTAMLVVGVCGMKNPMSKGRKSILPE